MIKKESLILLVAIILTSCATPYQKNANRGKGGYQETKLSANRYQVFFFSNGNTYISQTKDFLLLRSSEIALENNYRYFLIDKTTRHIFDPYSVWDEQGTNAKLIPWSFESIIILYKDKPSKSKKIVYDAILVKKGIISKYKEKKKESIWDIIKKGL